MPRTSPVAWAENRWDPLEWEPAGLRLAPARFAAPLTWKKSKRIVVQPLHDVLDEHLPFTVMDRIVGMVWAAQWHTFLVTTRDAARLAQYMQCRTPGAIVNEFYPFFAAREPAKAAFVSREDIANDLAAHWPLSNLWCGVAVESQVSAEARISWLLETPAALRFVRYTASQTALDLRTITLRDGDVLGPSLYSLGLGRGLDWVICGGGTEPTDLSWLQCVVEQCQSAHVPCFVESLGRAPYQAADATRLRTYYPLHGDKQGRSLDDFPPDLQVQQLPMGHVH